MTALEHLLIPRVSTDLYPPQRYEMEKQRQQVSTSGWSYCSVSFQEAPSATSAKKRS